MNGAPEGKTGSPKLILKTAYQMGMIQDEQLWLEALQARIMWRMRIIKQLH